MLTALRACVPALCGMASVHAASLLVSVRTCVCPTIYPVMKCLHACSNVH